MDFVRTAKGTYVPVRDISYIYENSGEFWLRSDYAEFNGQQVLARDLPKTEDDFGVIPNVDSGYKIVYVLQDTSETPFEFEFEIHPVLGWIVRGDELTPLIQEQWLVDADCGWYILRPDGTVNNVGTSETMKDMKELKRSIEKSGGVYIGGTLPDHGD